MAWGSIAQSGTGASSTSGTTLTMSPSATIADGSYCLLTIAADNTSTADGDNSEVSSVADNAGGNTWAKLGELTNSPGGVAWTITGPADDEETTALSIATDFLGYTDGVYHTSTQVAVALQGGTAGATYRVDGTWQTAQGREDSRALTLVIEDR